MGASRHRLGRSPVEKGHAPSTTVMTTPVMNGFALWLHNTIDLCLMIDIVGSLFLYLSSTLHEARRDAPRYEVPWQTQCVNQRGATCDFQHLVL